MDVLLYGPSKKLQTPANVFVTNVVISDVLSEFIFVLRLVFLPPGRITSHLFVGLHVAELLKSTLLRLSALSRIRIASSRVHLLLPSSGLSDDLPGRSRIGGKHFWATEIYRNIIGPLPPPSPHSVVGSGNPPSPPCAKSVSTCPLL